MTPPDDRPLLKQARWFQLADVGSLGLEMGIAVAIGFFAGRWLERNVTHWAPWTTYIGLAVGFGAATLAIVRTARKYLAQLRAEEQASPQAHEPGPDGEDP